MKKIHFFLLVLIFCLGLLLRFYRLGEVPNSLHRDEAFLGYNAYAILETGKDINGNFLPLHLASFLYTPAGYAYISIPFIKLFGLDAFSVRFASALFGSFTILMMFFLTRELVIPGQTKVPRDQVAFLSSFLLAISPWHINLSRTASVITLVVFFATAAVFCYFLSLRKQNNIFLLLSLFLFGLSLTFYIAPYSFLPLFIPFMYVLFTKQQRKKKIISTVILFSVVILLPLFFTLFSRELSLRARSLSIFEQLNPKLVLEQVIREDGVADTYNNITRMFHNKIIIYSSSILENYFQHFSYQFLFTDKGYPDRYRVPLMGLMYIYSLFLIPLGIFYLLKEWSKVGLFLLIWVLLVPIGSSLTSDDIPNLQRTLIVLPPLIIIESFAIFFIYSWVARYTLLVRVLQLLAGVFILYNVLFYLHQYYTHMPLYHPWYRHDGYKELVKSTNNLLPLYKKAVITNKESAPTIFFLLYGRYDPVSFQRDTKDTTMHDFDRINFGKYEFSQEECPLQGTEASVGLRGKPEVLYVNSGLCPTPENVKELGEIKRSDNSVVFRILTLKEQE